MSSKVIKRTKKTSQDPSPIRIIQKSLENLDSISKKMQKEAITKKEVSKEKIKDESKVIMKKKKKGVAMLKKKQHSKHNNSIMQLGRNTVLALAKKVKKWRENQLSSIYNSNATIDEKKIDSGMLQTTFNNTTINANMKILRNISRSIKNYKPPKYNHMGVSK